VRSLRSIFGGEKRDAAAAVRDAAPEVAARVEAAEIHQDPFPHLVIDPFLPRPTFDLLAAAMPATGAFESIGKTKLDLDIADTDPYFSRVPAESHAAWTAVRDAIFRETVAPILSRRLRDGLLEKYRFLFGEEIGSELVDRGFTSTDGRIQGRRPGYDLRAHLDSAHFGITCLLYFSRSGDDGSGALCLFRPEREPEVKDASTYYPTEQEGIVAEVAKTIPVVENRAIAFLNVRNALHGVSVAKAGSPADFVRFAYQCQVVPRGFQIETLYPRLEPRFQERWQRLVEKKEPAEAM
jgi:hypothetical protein